jgi:hypothetical protein
MSAERALPSSSPARLVCGAAMIVFGLASSSCRGGPEGYVVQSRRAPAGQPALSAAEGRIAAATLARCDGGWCETLAIGASGEAAQALATLPSVERCTEIAWSPNGARVGFLINGTQLRLYDAASHAPAGQIDLVPRDADPSTRIARGLTFSDNGAAITFDDCPRDRSGCRPGIVALR